MSFRDFNHAQLNNFYIFFHSHRTNNRRIMKINNLSLLNIFSQILTDFTHAMLSEGESEGSEGAKKNQKIQHNIKNSTTNRRRRARGMWTCGVKINIS